MCKQNRKSNARGLVIGKKKLRGCRKKKKKKNARLGKWLLRIYKHIPPVAEERGSYCACTGIYRVLPKKEEVTVHVQAYTACCLYRWQLFP